MDGPRRCGDRSVDLSEGLLQERLQHDRAQCQRGQKYPDRFIVNGAFDPRDGEKALEYIHYMKETFDIQGVKLYTAEWNGASKGLEPQ